MSKITFADKEDIRSSSLPRENRIGADDINEIKAAVNNIALLTYDVILTKAQLNTIDADGGVNLLLSDLGCGAGEGVILHPNYFVTEVFRDGVNFNSSGQFLSISQDLVVLSRVDSAIIESTSDGKFGSGIRYIEFQKFTTSDFLIECNADISGGGPDAFIKITFYYQIVTV